MMSFNRKIFYAISVITFIVFNVIAFIVPINRNADFWVGYTFVCLTILWIVIALNVIIKDTDSLNDIFETVGNKKQMADFNKKLNQLEARINRISQSGIDQVALEQAVEAVLKRKGVI